MLEDEPGIQNNDGYIDQTHLRSRIEELIKDAKVNDTDYHSTMESISDVIALKQNDSRKIELDISQRVTQFIINNYNSNGLIELSDGKPFTGDSDKFEASHRQICYTTSTLMILEKSDDARKFVHKVLSNCDNWLERASFEGVIKYYFETVYDSVYKIDFETVDKVVATVNMFCKEEFSNRQWNECEVALANTIKEHPNSFSILTCSKSDLYVSPCKRKQSVGLGRVFVSKSYSRAARAGSAPTNWVDWFETQEKKFYGS